MLVVSWNCICCEPEPEVNLSSIMLVCLVLETERMDMNDLPPVGLVGRCLCLFRGDSSFGLVHFYPT